MSQTKEHNKTAECLKRIQNHQGVVGVIVCNSDGIPISTTLDNSTTLQYANSLNIVYQKCRSTVRTLDPQNELDFLRIRTRKHEIMLAPTPDCMIICVQNPQE